MRMVGAALAALVAGGPAAAQGFVGCTSYQEATAGEAIASAAAAARAAAAAVSVESPTFRFWFGEPTEARAEVVRATLKRVAGQLADPRLTVECVARKADCAETFAYVTATPGVIRLCPDYFRMPSLVAGDASGELLESGTREGTIVHETTHFEAVGGTGDSCYDRTPCATLAAQDPGTAVMTADNYQFFTEDVALARARRGEDGGEDGGQ